MCKDEKLGLQEKVFAVFVSLVVQSLYKANRSTGLATLYFYLVVDQLCTGANKPLSSSGGGGGRRDIRCLLTSLFSPPNAAYQVVT